MQGPSGSGKTLGALRVALGLTNGRWDQIAIIDSENRSADLYAELGPYQVLHMNAPYCPEDYIQAMSICEKAGMQVIILDSISHEWESLLDYQSKLPGNSFINWSKVSPRHSAFLYRMLCSSAHIIATVRTKTDYVLTDRNGKIVPEKVGLKGIQRDGNEYEFSICFDLDIRHFATTSKDRTRLYMDQLPFQLDETVGGHIRQWCQINTTTSEEVQHQIEQCATIPDLVELFHQQTAYQVLLKPSFERRKHQLLLVPVQVQPV
ncbi:AAA family ATPase [Spirosoma pollinicola]|uniref:AAA family ATPase n=1 Tax=Spirosoma pollinicola TaxID=2057025 RepID=A0A2K8ZC48_9BACT|nr:AAA family ATPase [Spirosoma pollinicola]